MGPCPDEEECSRASSNIFYSNQRRSWVFGPAAPNFPETQTVSSLDAWKQLGDVRELSPLLFLRGKRIEFWQNGSDTLSPPPLSF